MVALVKLDGASTNLIHFVEGCDLSAPETLLEKVRSGVRVTATFRPVAERQGHILDIRSFTVIE
jgi:uncharacterized OB-fold protein